MKGELKPGERIVEANFARALGVGQSSIREALLELEHQGFIKKLPDVGTFVTDMTLEQLKDIYAFRLELEVLAAKWARRNLDSRNKARLRQLLSNMRKAARTRDYQGYFQADLEFHRLIWKLSGNRCMLQSMERHVVPMFVFFSFWSHLRTLEYDANCHQQILAAMSLDDREFEVEIRRLFAELEEKGMAFAERMAAERHRTKASPSVGPEAA